MKPLVIMTPKSLLRHPDVRSERKELSEGIFNEIIDDLNAATMNTDTIILTSGKIYYELLKYKNDNNLNNFAIVRVEQYYPFPADSLEKIFDKYFNAKKIIWVQEEPENMGALFFMRINLEKMKLQGREVQYVSRNESASPAPGSYKKYNETQKQIIIKAFS